MNTADAANEDGRTQIGLERQLVDYDESLRSGSTHGKLDPLFASEEFLNAKACIDLMHRVWHGGDTANEAIDETYEDPPDDEKVGVAGQPSPQVPRAIGRFSIIRELGRGGLGIVFLARDPRLGRHVALKVPRPEALISSDARRRFLTEGEIAASLRHPGIVSVHEVGEDGPVCFIAAEYSDGQTLGNWIAARQTPVPTEQAARIVADLAEAVSHAHSRGVIHRDIKPSNVMVETTGGNRTTVKLTDFGTAKLLEADEQVTRTGALIGTAAYMAPEQASGRIRDVDVRTDVHALGAVLYELLTGCGPFAAANEAASIHRVVSEEPARPRRLRLDVPRDLEAICLKCLNKEQADRYGTANDLAHDLQRFLAGEPTLARPITTLERTAKWARRRPALAGLGTAFGIGLVAFTVVVGLLNVRLQTAVESQELTNDRLAETNEHLRNRVYSSDMEEAYGAFAGQSLSSARNILTAQLPEVEGDSDLRDWSWQLLDRMTHQSLSEWTGHDPVFTVAVSPDGRWVASGDEGSKLVVRDFDSAEVVISLDTGQGEVNTVTFSPDGSELATAGKDSTVRRWRTADWSLLGEALPHDDEVYAVAYAPDGSWLASGGRDSILRLWRQGEATPFQSHKHPDHIECLAISPTGGSVVTGGKDARVRCFDVKSGNSVWAYPPGDTDGSRMGGVSFSPDGRLVAVCQKDATRVQYIDNHSGERIGESPEVSDLPVVCQFTPNGGQVVIGCRNGRVHALPAPASRLCNLNNPVMGLDVSGDRSRLAIAPRHGGPLMYDFNGERHVHENKQSQLDLGRFSEHVALSHDGRLMAIVGATSGLYDLENNRLLWTLVAGPAPRHAEFSSDGRWIAFGHHDGRVNLHGSAESRDSPRSRSLIYGPCRKGTFSHSYKGTWDDKSQATFLADEGILVKHGNGQQRWLYRPADADELEAFRRIGQDLHCFAHYAAGYLYAFFPADQQSRDSGMPVECFDFSPDGRFVAAATGRSVILWPTGNADTLYEACDAAEETQWFFFTKEFSGWYLLTAGLPQDVALEQLAPPLVLDDQQSNVTCARYSPDGRHLATAARDGTILVYDTDQLNSAPGVVIDAKREILSLLFSPDGSTLYAAGAGSQIDRWDVATGQRAGETLAARSSRINGIDSLDDSHIVCAGDDGQVTVCSISQAEANSTSGLVHSGRLWSLAISPDGQRIVTSGDDRTVRVTRLESLGGHRRILRLPETEWGHIHFSNDGRCFAQWNPDTRDVSVRDAASGQLAGTVEFPPDLDPVFKLSPDGGLLAVGNVADVEIKRPLDNQPVCRLEGHRARVTHISFSSDATLLATAADDGTARLWDTATGEQLAVVPAEDVVAISCSADDLILAVADGTGTIRVWDQHGPEPFRTYEGFLPAQDVEFSPRAREFAVADVEGHIRMHHVDDSNAQWQFLQNGVNTPTSVVFSPDGTFVLDVKHEDHHIVVVDAKTGARSGEIVGFDAVINSCRFTPDGSNVVVACRDGSVHVRPIPALRVLNLPDVVTSLDVSRDGRRVVAVTRGGHIELVEFEARRKLWNEPLGDMGDRIQVAFTPDERFVGAFSHSLFVHDATNGRSIHTSDRSDAGNGHGLAFSKALGLHVSVSATGDIHLYRFDDSIIGDPPTVVGALEIAIHDDSVDGGYRKDTADLTSCDLSPDERWLAISSARHQISSAPGQLIIWPIAECIESVRDQGDDTRWIIQLRDGKLLLEGSAADIDWPSAEVLDAVPIVIDFPAKRVECVQFSPDGRLVAACGQDGQILVYDLAQRRVHCTFQDNPSLVRTVLFSNDSQTLYSAGEDDHISQWSIEHKHPIGSPLPIGTHVNDLGWLAGDRLVWAGDDGHVGMAVFPRYPPVSARGAPTHLAGLAISRDGERLILLDTGGVLDERSIASLSPRRNSSVSDDPVRKDMTAMALSAAADLVAVAYGPKVQIASAGDGRTTGWLDQYQGDFNGDQDVNAMVFSPDGSLLATADAKGLIWLWQVPSCQRMAILKGHVRTATAVAFSPDGRLLASGSGDRTVILWDVATRSPVAHLEGHSGFIAELAFSPSGRMLASGGGDATVKIWDAADGLLLRTLPHDGNPRFVAFSPDGKTLCTATEHGRQIDLWHADTGRRIGRLPYDADPEQGRFSSDSVLTVLFSMVNSDLSEIVQFDPQQRVAPAGR